ncbi:MAG: hypothetical protein JW839_21640 [Candidatus Lokiarchaeota archaeon]|nr:hypothetical protein [Candidatus Lokiarchaeota archaeon]
MTTFPRYMVKRLVPEDAVKLVGDEIQVTIVNVLATIPFDRMPENFIKSIVVKVDDEVVASADKPDLISKTKLVVKGKAYQFDKINGVEIGELPPGEAMVVAIPNVKGFKKGETHAFEVTMQYRPKKNDLLIVAFERKIT